MQARPWSTRARSTCNRVDAQQARRVLDRLVGYEISPLLWRRMGSRGGTGLSAGRVQSVALRLICDREREIAAFVPEEYWSHRGRADPAGPEPQPSRADLKRRTARRSRSAARTEAEAIVAELQQAGSTRSAQVEEKDRAAQRRSRPSSPARCSARRPPSWASRPARPCSWPQQLYEGVDDRRRDRRPDHLHAHRLHARGRAGAGAGARASSSEQFGESYVGPGRARQDGQGRPGGARVHPARPRSCARPEQLRRDLDKDQARLYELIWRRFVASQMAAGAAAPARRGHHRPGRTCCAPPAPTWSSPASWPCCRTRRRRRQQGCRR